MKNTNNSEKTLMLYSIEIIYEERSETIQIKTNDIKWSMSQYQRNREPFNWKIIKEEIY